MRNRIRKCCLNKNLMVCDCKKFGKAAYEQLQHSPRCRPRSPASSAKYSISTSACKTWSTRNNSSSIAAVLHPSSYVSTPDSESLGHCCRHGVRRKYCLGENNCYCNEKQIRPSLLPRPKTCIVDFEKVKPKIKVSKESLSFRLVPCSEPEAPSVRLKRIRKASEASPCSTSCELRYSRDRTNYEHIRDTINEEYLEQIRRFDEAAKRLAKDRMERYPPSFSSSPPPEGEEVAPKRKDSNSKDYESERRKPAEYIAKPPSKCSKESSEEKRRSSKEMTTSSATEMIKATTPPTSMSTIDHSEVEDIEQSKVEEDFTVPKTSSKSSRKGSKEETSELAQFRKDHYAETHSSSQPDQEVPDHRCVHTFKLNDRLFPQALNSDVYGTSRCAVCEKIMPIEKTVYKDQRLEKKTFPKYYQYGAKPTRVNVGAGNAKIVLKLSDKEAHLLRDCPFQVTKKPLHHNTYALRFQRGVR